MPLCVPTGGRRELRAGRERKTLVGSPYPAWMPGPAPPQDALGANWHEVVWVVMTGLLHLLISNVLELQAVFIAVALTGWIAYAVWRSRRDPEAPGRWGFRRRGLFATLVATSLFASVAGVAMAWVGHRRGTLGYESAVLPLFLLYPAWGLVQQSLVQALVAGNLRRSTTWASSTCIIVPFCAVLFGLVHMPDWALVAATFTLGLVFTPIYLRWRNLWFLGIYHGWLGALFYVWVLGRNPWAALFR